jgi:hypothetical protein
MSGNLQQSKALEQGAFATEPRLNFDGRVDAYVDNIRKGVISGRESTFFGIA